MFLNEFNKYYLLGDNFIKTMIFDYKYIRLNFQSFINRFTKSLIET